MYFLSCFLSLSTCFIKKLSVNYSYQKFKFYIITRYISTYIPVYSIYSVYSIYNCNNGITNIYYNISLYKY